MKKTAILSLAFLFFSSFMALPSYSFEFKKRSQSEKEIRAFLNDYNKVLVKNDLKTLAQFYDSEYRNTDGYDLEELIAMIDKTTKAFEDIKYRTKITGIDIRKDCAAVHLSDVTTAKVYPSKKFKNRDKIGKLRGESTSVMYLKKEDGMWKIHQDSVLSEETSLKYGVAKKIAMDLDVPESVKNGQDYGLTLNMKTPNKIIALASLAREEVNSEEKFDEKFRKFPSRGNLERLVKANANNKDEYAVASVGFTKVSLNKKEKKARIEILGMAYMMKRINMDNMEPVKNEVEKN